MAFPAPIPANAVSGLPCCATSYLYSIGSLHYYATVDCETGDTGVGVSGTRIDPKACNGTTCDSGSIVTPYKLYSAANAMTSSSFLGTSQKHPFRRTQSRELLRKLRLDLKFLKGRPTPVANGKDGIADRRRKMAEYLIGPAGDTGELLNIDDLPHDLRDAFFDYVHQELVKVRIDDAGSSSRGFVVLDKDLELDTLPFGDLVNSKTPVSDPTKVNYFTDSMNVTVSDASFKTSGAMDPITPFVQLRVRRVASLGGSEDQDVYFRVQKVDRFATATAPAFTHYVGQQIGAAHLKWGGLDPVPAAKIVNAKWIDRHSHFHVIEATPDGGTAQQMLVYSSLNLAAAEQFT